MDGPRLSDSRKARLEEAINEMRVWSRRAKFPEDRIALAEIEHELNQIKKRWAEVGLINGQAELPLASEASR
jgi:hypothetical protein